MTNDLTKPGSWQDELRGFIASHKHIGDRIPRQPVPPGYTIDWPNVGRATPADVEAFLAEIKAITEPKEQP